MVAARKWTVRIEREIDGIRIVKVLARLSGGEVHALRYEEKLLQGRLVSFDKEFYQHGDIDRSWTEAMSVTTESPGLNAFAMLRQSFTNELKRVKR